MRCFCRVPARPEWLGVGLAIGLLAAVLWSYEFVDDVIGGTIADTLLGFDVEERPSLDRPPGRCSPS